MKKKFGVFVLIAALMIAVFRPPIALKAEAIIPGEDAMPGPEEKIPCNATLEDEFADDTVLVVLNNAASLSSTVYSAVHFPGIGCTGVQDLTQTSTELALAKLNGEGVPAKYQTNSTFENNPDFYDVDLDSFRRVLCLKLNRADKQNVLDVIAQLENREDVLYAGPDYIMTVHATTPNDPYEGSQFINDTIDLPAAWDIETGFGGVAVGVIDTGIDYTHPDLRDNVNVGLSRNFLNGGNVQETSTSLNDPFGHGTHVAGIIGAIPNNKKGITGLVWDCELHTTDWKLTFWQEDKEEYAKAVKAYEALYQ